MPFNRSDLGSEQGLIDDPVLGQGRDPLAPLLDVITDEGDIVVPVDPRYLGLWLTGLFGDPTSSDNGDGSYDHEFASGGENLPSYTIEVGMPNVPAFFVHAGVKLNSLALEFSRSGPAATTINAIAQGETRHGTTQGGTPTSLTFNRISQFQGSIKRAGSPVGNLTAGSVTVKPDGHGELVLMTLIRTLALPVGRFPRARFPRARLPSRGQPVTIMPIGKPGTKVSPSESRRGSDVLQGLVVVCVAGAALMATAASQATEKTIQLGAVYSTAGSQADFDQPSARGAELAVTQANAEDGVLGRQIELVSADPGSDFDAVADRTLELIDAHPSLAAVFGVSDSDMALAAASVAAGRGLAFMTSGATSPKLPGQVPNYLFLACFGDNVQAAAAAEYAYHDLGTRTASVLYNSARTYTNLLQGYFRTRFEELGGKIVSIASYATIDDQSEALASLAEADVVFLAAEEPAEAAAGVVALQKAGIQVPILGGDGFDGEDVWSKHPDIGEVYFTTHAYLAPDNPNPTVGTFYEAYQNAYDGRTPDAFAALGYDAAGLLFAAIEAGGSAEPAEVLASLAGLRDYQGVTGTISYLDGSRIPRKSVTILEVRDGKAVFVEEVMPERVPAP